MQGLIIKAKQELLYYFKLLINVKKTKTILFYPEYPHRRTIIYKILKHLRYNITSNPKHKFDIAFYWEDTTFREKSDVIKKLNQRKVINLNCTDISKKRISESFREVFGYGFEINPEKYEGECVKKNNLNAKHDGFIINCPIKKTEEGYVYQKVLNNIVNDKYVMDIRVPIFKGEIPFMYLKFKLIENRFTNEVYNSKIASVNEYLTEEEVNLIIGFCKNINLDYGELDVLRNNDDRKIYIVDVNYTPWGPPAKLSEDETRLAVIRLSEVFIKVY